MSLHKPDNTPLDGNGIRPAIVAARYNETYVGALLQNAQKNLDAAGTDSAVVERVPGSAELPFAVSLLAESGRFDVILALGVVIAGDTQHHRIIGDTTATVLQRLSFECRIPIINGILVVDTPEEADARTGEPINRGGEFARAALEMAQFRKRWSGEPDAKAAPEAEPEPTPEQTH